jgi:hypothetical protein
VELLNEAKFGVNTQTLADHLHKETIERVADYLMSNNVVVLPCKFDGSQKVYYPVTKYGVIYETRVWGIGIDEDGDLVINPIEYNPKAFSISGAEFGKTLFLTKEEAEEKVKEMGNGT